MAGGPDCLVSGAGGCLLADDFGCLVVAVGIILLVGWVVLKVIVFGLPKVTFFLGRLFVSFYLRDDLPKIASIALASSFSRFRSCDRCLFVLCLWALLDLLRLGGLQSSRL